MDELEDGLPRNQVSRHLELGLRPSECEERVNVKASVCGISYGGHTPTPCGHTGMEGARTRTAHQAVRGPVTAPWPGGAAGGGS